MHADKWVDRRRQCAVMDRQHMHMTRRDSPLAQRWRARHQNRGARIGGGDPCSQTCAQTGGLDGRKWAHGARHATCTVHGMPGRGRRGARVLPVAGCAVFTDGLSRHPLPFPCHFNLEHPPFDSRSGHARFQKGCRAREASKPAQDSCELCRPAGHLEEFLSSSK